MPRPSCFTLCTGGWMHPRASLDTCGKSHPHWRDPQTLQPIASRYTDNPALFLLAYSRVEFNRNENM